MRHKDMDVNLYRGASVQVKTLSRQGHDSGALQPVHPLHPILSIHTCKPIDSIFERQIFECGHVIVQCIEFEIWAP